MMENGKRERDRKMGQLVACEEKCNEKTQFIIIVRSLQPLCYLCNITLSRRSRQALILGSN